LSVGTKISAWDYKDLRHRYVPSALDTTDDSIQEKMVRFLEPAGSRGPFEPTGTHAWALEFWGKGLHADKFTQERINYMACLDDQTLPFFCGLMHRTFAKTALAIVACDRRVRLRIDDYILYTSSEFKIAARRTEMLRAACMNAKIQQWFGKVEPKKNQKAEAGFSEDTFFLIDSTTGKPFCCVNPRGSGQTVNGSISLLDMKFSRVSLIVNDDGQDRKNISTASVRSKHNEFMDAELLQTIDAMEQPGFDHLWHIKPEWGLRVPWRVWVIDTCKHRQAYLMGLLEQPAWHSMVVPLAEELGDGKYRSLTALMTDEQVQAMADRIRCKPDGPDFWAREYLCKPSSGEDAIFKKEYYRYFSYEGLKKERNELIKFLVVDPAKSGGNRGSKWSILSVAVDIDIGRIYFIKNVVRHMDVDVGYQTVFDIAKETGTRLIFTEDNGLSQVLHNAMTTAASITGLGGVFDFRWLTSSRRQDVEYGTGDDAIKRARAAAPFSYYKAGLIFHEDSMRGKDLEQRQAEYPECSNWDETDTAGYVPEILEELGIALDCGLDEEDAVQWDEEEFDDFERCGQFFANRSNWCR